MEARPRKARPNTAKKANKSPLILNQGWVARTQILHTPNST